MIKKMKKVILSLAAVTIIGMPIGNVMAASMTFTNYKFTTVPNSESYIAVSSKAKADNDKHKRERGKTALSSLFCEGKDT